MALNRRSSGLFRVAALGALIAIGLWLSPTAASAEPASGIIQKLSGWKLFGDGVGFAWGFNGPTFVMARSSDQGDKWSTLDLGAISIDANSLSLRGRGGPAPVSAHFADADHGWIVWSSGDSTLHIASTADSGAHWREALSVPTDAVLAAEAYPASGRAVLEAEMAEGMMHSTMVILSTHDDGVTWSATNLPYHGDGMQGWTFRNANDGFASVIYPAGTSILFYRTRDGGRRWEPVELPLPSSVSPEEVDGTFPEAPVFSGADRLHGRLNVKLAMGNGSLHIVYRTSDGGKSWSIAPDTASASTTLQEAFDNAGVSDDQASGSADFDGGGYSYSAQALAAAGVSAGRPILADGVRFIWPRSAPGSFDNVIADGQLIRVEAPVGTRTLAFLGSATNGPSEGIATLHYSDGSVAKYWLRLSDWALNAGRSRPLEGNRIVASMPYRNCPSCASGRQMLPMELFAASLPVAPDKELTAINLPTSVNQGELHIFAIGTSTHPSSAPISRAVSPPVAADLAGSYDNIGISADGNTPCANFDGAGYSYSAAALAVARLTPGAIVHADGFNFTWPKVAACRADNLVASGQTIAVHGNPGASRLGLLGSSSNGSSSGIIVIHYTDGTLSRQRVSFTDWAQPAGGGNIPVATMPYRNTRSGEPQYITMYLFAAAVPLDPSKQVESITLPNVSPGAGSGMTAMHIFALSL